MKNHGLCNPCLHTHQTTTTSLTAILSGFHSKIFNCRKMINESVKWGFSLVLFFHFNIHRCFRFAVYRCSVCWFVQMKPVVPHCLVRKSHDHEQDWKHSALLRTEVVFFFEPTVCQFSQSCPMTKKHPGLIFFWVCVCVHTFLHFSHQ